MKKHDIKDSKKIINDIDSIMKKTKQKLFEEIDKSFQPNTKNPTLINDLNKNEKDIFRKTMYEVAHSLSIYSKEKKIVSNLTNEEKVYVENVYSKMYIDPKKYTSNIHMENPHITYEANIKVEGSEEEIKTMKGILLGGDISVTVDNKKYDMTFNANDSYDRDIERIIELEVEKFLKNKFNIIKKELTK